MTLDEPEISKQKIELLGYSYRRHIHVSGLIDRVTKWASQLRRWQALRDPNKRFLAKEMIGYLGIE